MVSHENHVVSNHQQLGCLLKSLIGVTSNKSINSRHWSWLIVTLSASFLNSLYRLTAWAFTIKLLSVEHLKNLTYAKSTSVRVMARCRLATSHYVSQCWPRSLSPWANPQLTRWRSVSYVERVSMSWRHYVLTICIGIQNLDWCEYIHRAGPIKFN